MGVRFSPGLPIRKIYFDPLGSLCDFVDPNAWKKVNVQGFGWIGCYEWNGEKFKLHQDIIKRCKMKGPWGEFTTDNGLKTSISDTPEFIDIGSFCYHMNYKVTNQEKFSFQKEIQVDYWDSVCYYIDRYYEQM